MKNILTVMALLFLSGCASAVGVVDQSGDAPGFFHGFWHGLIIPFSFIGSLFDSDIAIYASPNNGGWYDFGFFVGIGGLAKILPSGSDKK